MIEVKDRVATKPNQYRVMPTDGSPFTANILLDDEPTEVGTPINKALFDSIAEHFTAEDGSVFNYSYDAESGQHGTRDADGTFHPFGDTTKLREALRFSGLDVDNMTDDEIYDALKRMFPEIPLGTAWDFTYKGNVEKFVTPIGGIYKLEVYGAKGGGTNGGRGGYSVGYIYLPKNKELFVCVGNSAAAAVASGGGYNGGGNGVGDNTYYGCGGGGATHIAYTNRDVLRNYSSNRDDLVIVAGGGGGAGGNYAASGGLSGGAGGGLAGGQGGYQAYGDSCKGGTQTAAGANGGFGYGASGQGGWAGGGGGGFYGGGTYRSSNQGYTAGGGGSGFIDNIPDIEYGGVSYHTYSSNGLNNGTGKATITLVAV